MVATTLVLGDVEVVVTRRAVRRATLRVHHTDGRVTLSAPHAAPERELVAFVATHLDWVRRERARQLEEARIEAARRPPALRAVDGETWWWAGDPWRLEVRARAGRPRVVPCPGGRLELAAPSEASREDRLAALERWQRRVLRAAAVRLVDAWSDRLGVEPAFLGIRRMSTRWGSCVPATGRVWLNLELVARPPRHLEVVVVHELVHLITPRHGERFRRLMDRHVPDWRELQRALDGSWPPRDGSAPVGEHLGQEPTDGERVRG